MRSTNVGNGWNSEKESNVLSWRISLRKPGVMIYAARVPVREKECRVGEGYYSPGCVMIFPNRGKATPDNERKPCSEEYRMVYGT